jgi:hypothetical protein
MTNNVPLSITALNNTVKSGGFMSEIAIGQNRVNTGSNNFFGYWALVVDRITLQVLQNFTFTDNNDAPAQLNQYLGNAQYMLILNSQNLSSDYLPAGQFTNFLQGLGAGTALMIIEQINETLNCGAWNQFNYVLVAPFDGNGSIDFSDYQFSRTYTLNLVQVQQPSGALFYTPMDL